MKHIFARLALFAAAFLLVAALCPVLAAPAETAVDAAFEGVYQFGQFPSDEAADEPGGVQAFSLEPLAYADQLNPLMIDTLNADTAFSDAITGSDYGPAQSIYLYTKGLKIPAQKDAQGKITSPQLSEALQAVLNAHPEWYFLYSKYRFYVIEPTPGTLYVSRVVLYTTGLYGKQLAEERADLLDTAQAIAAGFPANAGDAEKALLLHDYISSTVSYDSGAAHRYTLYGALMDRRAVCQGIALAYEYLLEQCGVSSVIVSSKALNHSWNGVLVDGAWYQTDCTWDQINYGLTPVPGTCRHTRLLLSRDALCEVHHDDPETSDQTASGIEWAAESYPDRWWNDLLFPVQSDGKGGLFWSVNGGEEQDWHSRILHGTISGKNADVVLDLGQWSLPPQSEKFSQTASAGLCVLDDYLYVTQYDRVAVYRLADLDGKDPQPYTLCGNLLADPETTRLIGLLPPAPGQSGVSWYGGRDLPGRITADGTLAAPAAPLQDPDGTEYPSGDVDGSGQADEADLLFIADALADPRPADERAPIPLAADTDGDGVVTLTDLVTLARLLQSAA